MAVVLGLESLRSYPWEPGRGLDKWRNILNHLTFGNLKSKQMQTNIKGMDTCAIQWGHRHLCLSSMFDIQEETVQEGQRLNSEYRRVQTYFMKLSRNSPNRRATPVQASPLTTQTTNACCLFWISLQLLHVSVPCYPATSPQILSTVHSLILGGPVPASGDSLLV